jgi:hypothetical protein
MRAQEREAQRQDVLARHHRNRCPLATEHLRKLGIRSGRDSFPRRAGLIERTQKCPAQSAGLAQNKNSRPHIQGLPPPRRDAGAVGVSRVAQAKRKRGRSHRLALALEQVPIPTACGNRQGRRPSRESHILGRHCRHLQPGNAAAAGSKPPPGSCGLGGNIPFHAFDRMPMYRQSHRSPCPSPRQADQADERFRDPRDPRPDESNGDRVIVRTVAVR